MNLQNIEITKFNVQGEFPDFEDSYIEEALYNGEPMTHSEIETLENEHSEWVYEELMDYIV